MVFAELIQLAERGCKQHSHVVDVMSLALCSVLPSRQVKADKDSGNLHRLQQASRGVTQATAAVVASTKSGKSQIEEKGEMNAFTKVKLA